MYLIVNENRQYVTSDDRLGDREEAKEFATVDIAEDRAGEHARIHGTFFNVIDSADSDRLMTVVAPPENDSQDIRSNRYCYCIVAARDGRVIAVQADEGNLSALVDTIRELGSPTSGYHVIREPVERARGLLFEVHPDHGSLKWPCPRR